MGAEVAAALRVSLAMAGSYLHYALALRERLPKVGALLCAGDIDWAMFRTIVYRSVLIEDPAALAAVDDALAAAAPRWPSLTRSRLAGLIDAIVADADPDALRRVRQAARERDVWIWDDADGLAGCQGLLWATDATALDKRLDALAASVCADDPRSTGQRRADALGALAAGAARLGCGCRRADCPAGGPAEAANVAVHVVAEQASLAGASSTPGYLIDTGATIPAQLLTELGARARQSPLINPATPAPNRATARQRRWPISCAPAI